MDTSNIIFAVIAAVVMIGGFFISRNGSASDLIAAATGLVDPLQRRITDLEAKVHDLQRQTTALELWGQSLAEQVKVLGGVPVPFEEFLARVVRANHG